jgi:glutaminyl-tRNA synthetase
VAPNKKFKRLVAGGEVRLRNAYVIRCDEVIKDGQGEIIELQCSYDAATLGANPEGRKVKGVIHWVSASHAMPAEIRLYDRLFAEANPGAKGADYRQQLNPDSLRTLTHCYVEPALREAEAGDGFQFEREGYFCLDPGQFISGQVDNQSIYKAVFNRTVTLRDTWAKIEAKEK